MAQTTVARRRTAAPRIMAAVVRQPKMRRVSNNAASEQCETGAFHAVLVMLVLFSYYWLEWAIVQ